ncbi:hypothetical protein AAL_04970 [Moelleriella libera RCEF 2490]|uniref:Uncharacterized protein n=1 Tax=Moelleriella libera RCEF 2490 TaxID=1081109 RepID=A0A168B6D5_9HYPO|nr:hypothetical protein AAL_04970 [Moelleriella libera RCEF 2490]
MSATTSFPCERQSLHGKGKGKGKGEAKNNDSENDHRTGDENTEKETESTLGRIRSSASFLISNTFKDRGLPTTLTCHKETGGEASTSALYTAHQAHLGSIRPASELQSVTRPAARSSSDITSTSSEFVAFTGEHSVNGTNHATSIPQIIQATTAGESRDLLDGSEVVSLLNEPEISLPPLVGEDEHQLLLEEDKIQLQAAIFDPGRRQSRWASLLDFNPAFMAGSESSEADAEALMGTTDLPEAQRLWLQQWHNVLSSYTEEVWGSLEPLAAEARWEISQCAESKLRADDFKALERLRLILSHLRGY